MAQTKLNTFGRVRTLEGWKAIAFSAALLERMLPNYQLFCETTGYDDEGACRHCLDLIWESLRSPKSRINFGLQLDKVEEATPDTQQYDFYGVYPAIDAAVALAATVNLIIGQDEQGAVVVSKLSQGSVEAYLLLTGEATDETVKSHPLMTFEIDVQQELLDILSDCRQNADTAKKLRELALEAGISNIGLEL